MLPSATARHEQESGLDSRRRPRSPTRARSEPPPGPRPCPRCCAPAAPPPTRSLETRVPAPTRRASRVGLLAALRQQRARRRSRGRRPARVTSPVLAHVPELGLHGIFIAEIERRTERSREQISDHVGGLRLASTSASRPRELNQKKATAQRRDQDQDHGQAQLRADRDEARAVTWPSSRDSAPARTE